MITRVYRAEHEVRELHERLTEVMRWNDDVSDAVKGSEPNHNPIVNRNHSPYREGETEMQMLDWYHRVVPISRYVARQRDSLEATLPRRPIK